MIVILSIFQYFLAAVTDVLDKFLISKEKIEPVNYTFYTVVTGAVLLIIWPWVFADLALKYVLLDLFSGAVFSLVMYLFFRVLANGEVSRVVPFIFGLVPVFDSLIAFTTGRNSLLAHEVAAMFLLVPGALIISHNSNSNWSKHVFTKLLCAFGFSAYYALWQYAAQNGPALNNLMWNRLGAALVLIILLILPSFRKKVFAVKHVANKKKTGSLFLFKQLLGGANFIFFSFLLLKGKISVINSLQGFRYVFIFLIALLLSHSFSFILKEQINKKIIGQKFFGLILICLGTLVLFLK